MQKHRRLVQDFVTAILVVLPVMVIVKVQQRKGAEISRRQEERPPGAENEFRAHASGAMAGFAYLRLPQNQIEAGQAVKTFRELVSKQERELGRDHPDTLMSRNNLANALLGEGRHAEAEAEERALLADMELALTPAHPDVFRCRFNLALNLRSQGKTAAAFREMEIVYHGWRVVLGEEHPRTQTALLVLENLKPPL
jgi:hypothetical protein